MEHNLSPTFLTNNEPGSFIVDLFCDIHTLRIQYEYTLIVWVSLEVKNKRASTNTRRRY